MKYCPKCNKRFSDTTIKCPDCEIDLIEDKEAIPEYIEFESIFKTSNPATIALAKSILEDADIPYALKSQGLQAIYALGMVQFQVPPEHTVTARSLLSELAKDNEAEIIE